jgi:hypothetical protein
MINALLGQSYRTLHEAVIDEYRATADGDELG